MKIVFSRKGFDSQNGGVPSPIFPDGTALSLPIPYPRSPTRFRDVRWRSTSLGPIVECLTNGRVKGKHRCHLDPDLNADALARSPGWRPAFGQVEIAQRHLENQGVGPGDLFLFFGWFRAVEPGNGGTWRYVRNAPDVHRLFGWLQVSEVVPVGENLSRARSARPWLSAHPHLNRRWCYNTVYIARETLNFEGLAARSGAGLFSGNGDRFTLTDPEEVEKGSSCRRSYWRLPEWFWPVDDCHRFSRKVKMRRREAQWIHIDSGGRGQEFVVDVDGIPAANKWVRYLFEVA